MHITLTGNLGSGKSTIGKILKEKYGFEIYSTGTIQRKLAAERGISVLEMNELMCSDHKYDHIIDDTTTQIATENPDKDIMFDSRLAWNFVPKSFKVFLSVSLDEAAKRVYSDASRGDVEKYKDIDECRAQLAARAANEDGRYAELYGVHYYDFSNYNLVLDSTASTPEVLADKIYSLAKAYYESGEETKNILFSTVRLGMDKALVKNAGEVYFAKEAKIAKVSDDYELVSGADEVKAAAESGAEFVNCLL